MKYDYREAVKEDVLNYIKEEIDFTEFDTLEELEEKLNKDLFCEDSVTGNGRGSYTSDTYEAEEYICHNLDLLIEVCEEFGTFNSLKQGAETADVIIRCFLLSECITAALEEIKDDFYKVHEGKEE